MELADYIVAKYTHLAVAYEGRCMKGRDGRGEFADRAVWSTPWRLTRRTRAPSLKVSIRQPSDFSSQTQPGRWNGSRTRVEPREKNQKPTKKPVCRAGQ